MVRGPADTIGLIMNFFLFAAIPAIGPAGAPCACLDGNQGRSVTRRAGLISRILSPDKA
jgi:hypothetical protein